MTPSHREAMTRMLDFLDMVGSIARCNSKIFFHGYDFSANPQHSSIDRCGHPRQRALVGWLLLFYELAPPLDFTNRRQCKLPSETTPSGSAYGVFFG